MDKTMYMVVHLTSGRVLKRYFTKGWAQRYLDKLVESERGVVSRHRWYTYETLAVMSFEEFQARAEEIDPMVEVKNMMSGKPVMIRKSQRGTCVDPSTETYWSM